MQVDRKFLLLGAALALLLGGCGKTEAPAPVAQTTQTTIGTEVDDAIVTAKVKSALLADPDVRSFDLKVETRKGVVQLSGFVESQAQVERAIATTGGVDGVRSIENGITLTAGTQTPGNKIDDSIITAKVKSSLLGDANVKSFDIAVVTRKGEVQLSGFVDSKAQIDQAVALAHKVEGVTSVGNEMSIKQ